MGDGFISTCLPVSLYVSFLLTCAGCTTNNHTKVIIVGAGLSGLGFATTLQEKQITDFLVLEAKNYIGGRVQSVVFDGKNVSSGAGWIHWVGDKNSFWKLKLKHKVRTAADKYSNFTVRYNGASVDGKAAYNKLLLAIAKAEGLGEYYDTNRFGDISLKTALELGGWKSKNDVEHAVEHYVNDFEHATVPERMSAYQAVFTETSEDHVVSDPRGISYIPEKLAEGIMGKIRLNTVVTNITYSSSGTGVTVLTKDGRRYTSDYIVVTVSTGVLASDLITFRPNLPDWKRHAITFLPMGHFTKIIIKFSRKFWDDSYYTLLASSKRGYYVNLQNMDRDGLYKGSCIVVIFVTFPESERVEKLPMAELKQEIADFFAKQYPSAMVSPSNITEIFCSSWTNDPYVMGAFSAPSVGADDTKFADLRAPYGSLWFAGEASSSDYGYVHGALDSGREQAAKLIDCMNNNKCPKYKARPSRACRGNSGLGTKPSPYLTILLFILAVMYKK